MDAEELRERWEAKRMARQAERDGTIEAIAGDASPGHRRSLWDLVEALESPLADQPRPHVLPGPVESPLEERVSELLIKALDDASSWTAQHEVTTPFGNFRLDFLLVAPSGFPRVAIECDGAKHHRGSRDDWRDAAILGVGAVDAVVRLRGRDVHLRPFDVLHALCVRFPALFSARGRANASRLASPEICEGLAAADHCVIADYPPQNINDRRRDRIPDYLFIKTKGTFGRLCEEWRWRHEWLTSNPAVSIAECAAQEDAELDAIIRQHIKEVEGTPWRDSPP